MGTPRRGRRRVVGARPACALSASASVSHRGNAVVDIGCLGTTSAAPLRRRLGLGIGCGERRGGTEGDAHASSRGRPALGCPQRRGGTARLRAWARPLRAAAILPARPAKPPPLLARTAGTQPPRPDQRSGRDCSRRVTHRHRAHPGAGRSRRARPTWACFTGGRPPTIGHRTPRSFLPRPNGDCSTSFLCEKAPGPRGQPEAFSGRCSTRSWGAGRATVCRLRPGRARRLHGSGRPAGHGRPVRVGAPPCGTRQPRPPSRHAAGVGRRVLPAVPKARPPEGTPPAPLCMARVDTLPRKIPTCSVHSGRALWAVFVALPPLLGVVIPALASE